MRLRQSIAAAGQDLMLAVRGIRREPGPSLVVIVTLALGIGANAAAFGVVDRLLLSGPEHVDEANRVLRLYVTQRLPAFGERTGPTVPYPLYDALRQRVASFSEVGAVGPSSTRLLSGAEGNAEVRLQSGSWNLFPLLGVEPAHGRFFLEEEDRSPDGALVTVLGHALWQRHFGGDPTVMGARVRLGSLEYTVVGVAPKGFNGPRFETVDAWIPLSASGVQPQQWTSWNSSWLQLIARLRPDATVESATAEVDAVYRSVTPDNRGWQQGSPRLSLAPIRHDPQGREPLEARVSRWLFGVSLLLLLIACANVASLHLARGVRREREAAVRLALGSGRARLIRASLAHVLVLASIGGVLAMLVAQGSSGLLRRVLAPSVAWESAPIDGRIFSFALLATLLTAALIGLLPALQGARRDVVGALHRGQSVGGARHSKLLGALAAAQTAAATVLLIGAGLFARSLENVLSVPLGFEPDKVWLVSTLGGTPSASESFYAEGLERIETMPSVEGAAVAIGTPFSNTFGVGLAVPGYDSIPTLPGGGPFVSAVSSGYFSTMGTQLVQGRLFTSDEGAGTEPVVIVNETMAGLLWPGEDPLEKCLLPEGLEGACARVIGVVEDSKRRSVHDAAAMQWYLPLGQERGIGGSNLLVRPGGDPDETLGEVRTALQQIAGPSVLVRLIPLGERVDPEIRPWRAGALLFSVIGALALAVAAFGLYGLIAYTVAQRTYEVGLRMALGARAAQVAMMVLRQGLALVAAGLALGLLLTVAMGRFIEPALFEASPRDPAVLLGVSAVLLLVASAAAVVPSLRAAGVDPLIALRTD